jgi:hypothetical protein
MADDLFSKIEETKKVAIRLAECSAAVTTAVQRRDRSLSKLFADLHQLDSQLREMGKTRALKALKAQYRNKLRIRKDPGMLLLKLTYPSLHTKKSSKYAAVLRLVQAKKREGQSVKDFMRANGGIRGCVEKEKKFWTANKLWDNKKSGDGIGKGLKARKLTKGKNRASSMRSSV